MLFKIIQYYRLKKWIRIYDDVLGRLIKTDFYHRTMRYQCEMAGHKGSYQYHDEKIKTGEQIIDSTRYQLESLQIQLNNLWKKTDA